jgi:hypothetical protein
MFVKDAIAKHILGAEICIIISCILIIEVVPFPIALYLAGGTSISIFYIFARRLYLVLKNDMEFCRHHGSKYFSKNYPNQIFNFIMGH